MEIRYGLDVVTPWSERITKGEKLIETREYAIPDMLIGVPIAMIETGRTDRDAMPAPNAITGVATYESCFEYLTEELWRADRHLHLVPPDHPAFKWDTTKRKFGWVLSAHTPPVHWINSIAVPTMDRLLRSIFRFKAPIVVSCAAGNTTAKL